MNSYFPAHGMCHYDSENNIVIIDSKGPFNLEFFHEMHADLRAYVMENVDYKNFAILLIMRGNTIALPDGLIYHEQEVKKGSVRAIAISLSDSEYVSTTAKQMQRVYNNAGLKNAIIDDLAQAKIWLNQHLD